MTGYPSLENSIQTLKNGVVDFLIKPVNLNQMEIAIERVLRERQLFVKNILLTKEVESAAKLRELNEQLHKKNEELHTLNQIMAVFASVREHVDVFVKVVDLAVELANADEAHFVIVNEGIEGPVRISSSFGANDKASPFSENYSYDKANGLDALILEVIADQKPLLIAQNIGIRKLPPDIKSLMLVPLSIHEKVFGVIVTTIWQDKHFFSEKDLYYLSFMANKAAGAIENLALYENIYDNLLATLYAFVKAIEARDPYTEQHSNRVTAIAFALAKAMNCSEEELDILNVAGRLHDIGKIGICDDILLKPGRLTKEEYEIIKKHPVIGAEIVARMGLWDREKQIIRCHHERYDGSGYPDGLKGEEIPLLGRILSVADVYDAIASDRAYRKKMPEEKILKIMCDGAGTQFDPKVIDIFIKLLKDGSIQKINST
ncbi:MAG: HD domain-containing protein, partial [Desulfobacteraceae bacterium]|jgi:putative nucleotidyltransferase with HDIG domain